MNDNKSVSGVLINYFNLKLPKRHGVCVYEYYWKQIY